MNTRVVVGLAYGDEGKGSIVDYLVRKLNARTVVRYNGGPQASHHVVLPDGRSHGFSQFGAGTFAGASTYLSEYMMVEPYALENEAHALEQLGVHRPKKNLFINAACPIITPWHWRLNRLREMSRDSKHGTCGMGIGELRQDMIDKDAEVLRVGSIDEADVLSVLHRIRESKIKEARSLAGDEGADYIASEEYNPWRVCQKYWRVFGPDSDVTIRVFFDTDGAVFEGSQGVLLDEKYGWQPHTTWSDCTPKQAFNIILRRSLLETTDTIGILPLVYSRHGAGPFVTEYTKHLRRRMTDHNQKNPWQGEFRTGHFDAVAARYALAVTGIGRVALTMADYWDGVACVGYVFRGKFITDLLSLAPVDLGAIMHAMRPVYAAGLSLTSISQLINADVDIISSGPLHTDKHEQPLF